ncbi:cyclic pyranopterin monophosphate synthase MoaC [archaeon]|nr:cyclic pyranopterin monophosphate synthase MoaC [archaeon]
MIDVSGKEIVYRSATAVGNIKLKKTTVETIKEKGIKKGDPLTVGEIAAILAVKKTPELIPLCHNIPISQVDVSYSFNKDRVEARCTVITNAQTGVEMEALMGVTTALLNIWDMTKYLEKDENGQYPDAEITEIRVIEKRKGQ